VSNLLQEVLGVSSGEVTPLPAGGDGTDPSRPLSVCSTSLGDVEDDCCMLDFDDTSLIR